MHNNNYVIYLKKNKIHFPQNENHGLKGPWISSSEVDTTIAKGWGRKQITKCLRPKINKGYEAQKKQINKGSETQRLTKQTKGHGWIMDQSTKKVY